MDLQLAGKSVIVTGGTRGIGRAIVEAFVQEGAKVAFCARDAKAVSDYASALRTAGGDVLGTAVDITDRAALTGFIETAAARHGGVDAVVPNVSALAMPMEEAAWRAGFETDIMGTVATVEATEPYLARSSQGAVVIIASTAALEIYAGARPYNSIKAALVAYVSGMSVALGPKGIRVNTVSPGAVYFDGGVWQQIEREDPPRFEAMKAGSALNRMAKPSEIAAAVVFLASPAASFISGANLVVDGAMTKRIQY